MKTLLLFLVLLISGMIVQSQSIVSSDKLWSNVIFHYSSMTLSTEHIRFTNDTVINPWVYKRVERSLDENQIYWSFYGYSREDTEKRIFYRTNAMEPEHLLYALNLNVGDSAQVSGLINYSQNSFTEMIYFVTAIDSFLIGDTFRKQLHLSIPSGTGMDEVENWVDSVGSKSGILHNWDGMVGGDGFGLLCYSENDVLLYQNPSYPSCYVITNLNYTPEKGPVFQTSPNPASGQLTVTLDHPAKASKIYLFDITGRLQLTTCIRTGQLKAIVDVSSLKHGVYLLKVMEGEKVSGVEKVVVQ